MDNLVTGSSTFHTVKYLDEVIVEEMEMVLSSVNNTQNSALAVLTALAATMGIQITTDTTGTYIVSIAGHSTMADMGWKYSVNGIVYGDRSARELLLRPGDRITWFYGGPSTNLY
jgi:hypothetical protein